MQIYYRGEINFCNYKCEYCPFSKKKPTSYIINKDKKYLCQFVDKLENENPKENVAIMFLPYGEAMNLEYYHYALGRLSRLSYVDQIGIQTNMSFDKDNFIKNFNLAGGIKNKLNFWGTFHPSMISVDDFLKECNQLINLNIKFSVGAVGVPENITIIEELRGKLPDDIYLWINKMDGLKRRYSDDEIRRFRKIDIFFENELRRIRSNVNHCKGNFFIKSDGRIFGCPIGRASMGNLYDDNMGLCELSKLERKCNASYCDCYIAYNNVFDTRFSLYGQYPMFRNPFLGKTLIFDIDGTLLKKGEKSLDESTKEHLATVSKTHKLYFATSRNMQDVALILKEELKYFSGGVFSMGARIALWDENMKLTEDRIIGINICKETNDFISYIDTNKQKYNYKIKKYKNKGTIYKILLIFGNDKAADIFSREAAGKFEEFLEMYAEGRHVTFVAKGVSKLAGVEILCDKLGIKLSETAFWGDSEADILLAENVGFGVIKCEASGCEKI